MPTFTAPKRRTLFTAGRSFPSTTSAEALGFLLKEDGGKLLQENGDAIFVEGDLLHRLYTAPKRILRFTATRK